MFLRRNRRMSSDFREGAMQDIPLLTILGSFRCTSCRQVYSIKRNKYHRSGTALDMEVLIKGTQELEARNVPAPNCLYRSAPKSCFLFIGCWMNWKKNGSVPGDSVLRNAGSRHSMLINMQSWAFR